jgi:hypothetical protein
MGDLSRIEPNVLIGFQRLGGGGGEKGILLKGDSTELHSHAGCSWGSYTT